MAGSNRLLSLAVGLVAGAMVTQLIHVANHSLAIHHLTDEQRPSEKFEQKLKPEAKIPSADCPSATSQATRLNIVDQLFNRVRILCLIMTHPANYAENAVAVNNTWARRCNRYAFFGSARTRLKIPLVSLNIKEKRRNLWKKTWMSFQYAEAHFNFDNFDFILKADDDSYFVMENMRYLLLSLDPDQPSLLGRVFKPSSWLKQKYTSGGAGYLLSRGAAKIFASKAVKSGGTKPKACDLRSSMPEDVKMGQCLAKLGVRILDTEDRQGLTRFHPLPLQYTLGLTSAPDWLIDYSYHKFRACVKGCASPVSVSVHYVSPDEMYQYEFLLYTLRPIGTDPIAEHTRLLLEAMKRPLGE